MSDFSSLEFMVFDLENPISTELFEDFYDIMVSSFPKEERRTKQGFLSLVKTSERYKIYALSDGEKLVAFFSVWEFDNFTFGDHFAVCEAMRNKGIGAELLKKLLSDCRLPFILEAELPDCEIARRRQGFYVRNGFKVNPFPYLLPPMQEGCKPVPMHVLSYPKFLVKSEFKAIKETLYKEVYNTKTAAF